MVTDTQRPTRLIRNKGVPEGKAWAYCSRCMGNTYHDIKTGICQGCANREAREAAQKVSYVGT